MTKETFDVAINFTTNDAAEVVSRERTDFLWENDPLHEANGGNTEAGLPLLQWVSEGTGPLHSPEVDTSSPTGAGRDSLRK